MTRVLTAFALREWRDFFPTPWLNFVTETASLLITLTVYWFTARAFGGDYFSYVVAGDALLILPVALYDGIPRALRAAASDGTLELFLVEPAPPQRPLLLAALATLPREGARACFIFLAALILFSVSFSSARVPLAFLTLLPGLPVFLGLGLLAAAMLAALGRGSAVLGQLGLLACVLAGAYFPVGVLPPTLGAISHVSPFTIQLEIARAALGGNAVSLARIALLLGEGAVLLALGYHALGAALRRARFTGKPFHFPV